MTYWPERDREVRIVAETMNGRRMASVLDARGRRVERRIGGGGAGAGVVRVGHDARGLVASVGIDGHTPLLFSRDGLGREVRRSSAAGFRLDQAWDAAGQLRSQSAGYGASDLDGLRAAQAAAGPGTRAGRHYAWDRAGAPVGVDDLLWGATTYGSDANGQAAEARFGDGSSERFSYDATKTVVGVHFTWDGDVVAGAAPLRLDGTVEWGAGTRWHYEPGGFVPLAKQTAGGELLHLVTDHLGTPREMFDEGGGLCWAASFTTWGVVRGVRGPPPKADNDDKRAIYPRGEARGGNLAPKQAPEEVAYDCPIRFQGQWADDETGLHYNRFRHYDPLAAQYVSPDPIGLLGGERPQAYVAIPTAWIDALGLSSQIQQNAVAGAAREQAALNQLKADNPGATFDTQRYLRDANGKSVVDPVTGERRRIDIVVIKDGKATPYEVTSKTAPKTAQQQKEQNIINSGGTFITDRNTGKLIPVTGSSQLIRLP